MNLDELLHGYRSTCLLLAAVDLGILEQLSSGPSTAEELAARIGADAASLLRLLRGLAAAGVVFRQGDRWALLPAAGRLDLDLARIVGAEYLPAWSSLASAVRTGRAGFVEAFGCSVWEHRAAHPELRASFDRIMPGALAWPAELGFAPHGRIVDVGGGDGSLLAGLLVEHPGTRGIVFDLPSVAAAAERTIRAAGVQDRCEFVAGSFFEEVPAGGDIYLLRHILHDWDDTRAAAILARCRAAMSEARRLVVIERPVPEGWDVPSILRDLHMLAVTGGRERTAAEFAALLEACGFRIERQCGGVIGAAPCS